MTALPSKYPQKTFKPKPCKECGSIFQPLAPSHLNCSQQCADRQLASRYIERTYGITLEVYERMLEEQGGLCAICGGEGFVMKESHTMKLAVDHCHSTGAVRGLLCHNCNRALGLFKDNPAHLAKAISYLKV